MEFLFNTSNQSNYSTAHLDVPMNDSTPINNQYNSIDNNADFISPPLTPSPLTLNNSFKRIETEDFNVQNDQFMNLDFDVFDSHRNFTDDIDDFKYIQDLEEQFHPWFKEITSPIEQQFRDNLFSSQDFLDEENNKYMPQQAIDSTPPPPHRSFLMSFEPKQTNLLNNLQEDFAMEALNTMDFLYNSSTNSFQFNPQNNNENENENLIGTKKKKKKTYKTQRTDRLTKENTTTKKRVKKSCKYRGVSYHKGTKKWFCTITHNHRQFYLGIYKNKEMAARVYDVYARKLLGSNARTNLNFVDDDESIVKCSKIYG